MPDSTPEPSLMLGQPRAVTWRSLLAGSAAVAFVCGLTPINDFVFSDTSLTAGFMPIGLVLFEFLLIVCINAPLHRWRPAWALRTGELAVVLLMGLLACGLPNWGLMRFLIPMPVAPFHHGTADGGFWRLFVDLDLPAWLFAVEPEALARGGASAVVQWFYTSVPRGESIPWGAWIRPLAMWGIFIGAMFACLVSIARLVIDQWRLNERLPFPIVQVHAALIESPQAGRGLNSVFRSPWLWAGLAGVFFIHGLTGLNLYAPKYFPRIPLGYDLTGVLSEEPFLSLRTQVKRATLSFMIVGVTYFIRSKAAFSLWAGYLLVNVISAQQRLTYREIPYAAWHDQHLGACAAFVLGIFWIGRHHWARVIRNAVGVGGDSTYRISFWLAVAGIVTMIGWLLVVGVQLWIAALIVMFILAAHLVVARVVAETGLPFYRTDMTLAQVYSQTPFSWLSGRDVYFAGTFNALGPLTTRDSLLAFATTGMGLAQASSVGERRRLGGVVAWALVLGFAIAATATLYCQYSFPTPIIRDTSPARNYFGAEHIPKREVVDPLVNWGQGRFEPRSHSVPLHVSIGFLGTLGLEFASLRWAWWPLLPIGYVASHGAFIANSWFSIFIGWLAKVLIVRFGGASLFEKLRPLFVGVIFGEALAAGLWLGINAIVVMSGGESQTIRFLP